jgi:hypothetical protein
MTTAMDIRQLTDRGLVAFRSYLDGLRAGSQAPPPATLLTEAGMSQRMPGGGQVEALGFQSRLEAARYLHEALAEVASDAIENEVGMWGWLSLFYFDQVCPPDPAGRRRPGRGYRHILEPGYPFGHHHLLGGAYMVYTVYDCGEALAPLLLNTPLHVENTFCHQLASRQSFITNRGVMEAAARLYLDPQTQKPKRGAQIKRNAPGTLHRFIDVIQQLDLNYDLYSMTGPQVIALLPAEFASWATSKAGHPHR